MLDKTKISTNICPCCGAKIKPERQFLVSLDYNTVICKGLAIKVTPTQAELLFVLQKAYPRIVTTDSLIQQVWANRIEDDHLLRTMVYQTNLKIKALGYCVRSTRTRGYRLEQIGQISHV